ncbi:MAG: hypothetical protein WCK34_17935 [Bacteroidota bacterium]
MMKCIFILVSSLTTFSLLVIFAIVSSANDAPINLQSGGALALTGPLSVSMESEIVRIILGNKSYTVDATFNFYNSGDAVTLSVGFPKNGAGWLDGRFKQTSEFIKFETWVDNKPVKFIEQPNTASIEGVYTLPALIKHIRNSNNIEKLGVMAKDYRWMVKESVSFPSKKTTITRVRYEAPYENFGGECKGGLTYIYGTGSYWDGNIGESKFIVETGGIPKKEWPKDMVFVAEKDKNKIKCNTISEGTLQCIIKDYKPATPEAGVVVGVGCIDTGVIQ